MLIIALVNYSFVRSYQVSPVADKHREAATTIPLRRWCHNTQSPRLGDVDMNDVGVPRFYEGPKVMSSEQVA
jgi:hypothetical protein